MEEQHHKQDGQRLGDQEESDPNDQDHWGCQNQV